MYRLFGGRCLEIHVLVISSMQSVTWLLPLKQQKVLNQAAVAVVLVLVSAVKPSGRDNRRKTSIRRCHYPAAVARASNLQRRQMVQHAAKLVLFQSLRRSKRLGATWPVAETNGKQTIQHRPNVLFSITLETNRLSRFQQSHTWVTLGFLCRNLNMSHKPVRNIQVEFSSCTTRKNRHFFQM